MPGAVKEEKDKEAEKEGDGGSSGGEVKEREVRQVTVTIAPGRQNGHSRDATEDNHDADAADRRKKSKCHWTDCIEALKTPWFLSSSLENQKLKLKPNLNLTKIIS